jgi:hypothetical protein
LTDDVARTLGIDNDHIEVVRPHFVTKLPDRENLLDSGGRVGNEVESLRKHSESCNKRHFHIEADVLAKRLFGGMNPRLEILDLRTYGLLAVHRNEQRFLATTCSAERDSSRYRGLADSALARDEDQAPVGDLVQF